MTHPKFWTPEEVALALSMRRRGEAIEAISTQMGRSTNSVRRGLARYNNTGIPKERDTAEFKAEALSGSEKLKRAILKLAERSARASAERIDVAHLSPFERQERALRNGAGIQDNVRLDRFSESATELRQKLA